MKALGVQALLRLRAPVLSEHLGVKALLRLYQGCFEALSGPALSRLYRPLLRLYQARFPSTSALRLC